MKIVKATLIAVLSFCPILLLAEGTEIKVKDEPSFSLQQNKSLTADVGVGLLWGFASNDMFHSIYLRMGLDWFVADNPLFWLGGDLKIVLNKVFRQTIPSPMQTNTYLYESVIPQIGFNMGFYLLGDRYNPFAVSTELSPTLSFENSAIKPSLDVLVNMDIRYDIPFFVKTGVSLSALYTDYLVWLFEFGARF